MMVHEGPARVFDCEEDAIAAIKGGKIVAGDVVVIRYEGPKGGPGMREMLNPTSAIAGMGLRFFRSTDHRRTFFRCEPWSIHRTCFTGGSSRRPDRIWSKREISSQINIPEMTLNVKVSDEEMAARRAKWQPREPKVTSGYLARYASMVTSGNRGAMLRDTEDQGKLNNERD